MTQNTDDGGIPHFTPLFIDGGIGDTARKPAQKVRNI